MPNKRSACPAISLRPRGIRLIRCLSAVAPKAKAASKIQSFRKFRELHPEFPGMGTEQQKLQTKNQTKKE
jgi:hypothetical protein